jgi:phosphatidate cytidylyltransferase
MMSRCSDLKKRAVVSLFFVVALAFLIGYSNFFFVGILLACAMAGFAGVGVWEYAQFATAKKLKPQTGWMIGIAVLQVLASYVSLQFFNSTHLPAVPLALGVALFFLLNFRETTQAVERMAVSFFGVCYVAVPLSWMLGILYPTTLAAPLQDGRWWLGYLIVVTKATDIGAYFVGRYFGKHKLAPVLSPKKTWEGAAAGFLTAIVVSCLIYLLGKEYSNGSFDLLLSEALILGVFIGILGQIGDLAESLLKRDAAIKDSNALPGLGGVLDMLDSLLLTAPIVYFFLRLKFL